MKTKVCGLKYRENIEQVLTLDFDYLGFIFFPGSPRFVENELDADFIRSITEIEKVGVFVNENDKTILNIVDKYLLDFIQLHGNENAETVNKLSEHCKVIKVFHADENLNKINFSEFSAASLFLFETPSSLHGGSGKTFDHAELNELKINKPFLVSGGIHHSDFDPTKISHLDFTGIDVNSRYEISPAIKNIHQLQLLKISNTKNHASSR